MIGGGHLSLACAPGQIQTSVPKLRFPWESLLKLRAHDKLPQLSTSQRETMFPMRLLLVVAAVLLGLASAHNIQLRAHSRECFYESLHADDKMTVSFQVGDREFGGSGNLDIDFWVRWADAETDQKQQLTVVFDATDSRSEGFAPLLRAHCVVRRPLVHGGRRRRL